jgi:hypothetical protein
VNKTTRANRIRQVSAGLTKYYASTPLVLAGATYKPAALQTFLQADVDANDASTAARANWLNTVKVAKSTDAETDPVLRAIQSQVMAQYSEAPNAETVLADFGYSPRKKPTKTVQQKTAAVAQAKATREARGTKGPKAKAKIKGIVPAISADASQAVSPTPAPAVTAPAPAPAASSNSTSNGSASASPNAVTTNQSHA